MTWEEMSSEPPIAPLKCLLTATDSENISVQFPLPHDAGALLSGGFNVLGCASMVETNYETHFNNSAGAVQRSGPYIPHVWSCPSCLVCA